MPGRPEGIYDLVVNGELAGQTNGTGGHVLEIDMSTGGSELRPGPVGTVPVRGIVRRAPKDIEIWLPWNEATGWSSCAPTRPSTGCRTTGGGSGSPRQLDQPRLQRREPRGDLAGRGRGRWAA